METVLAPAPSLSLDEIAAYHISAVCRYGPLYNMALERRLGSNWMKFDQQVHKNQSRYVVASVFLSVVCLFSIGCSVAGLVVQKFV